MRAELCCASETMGADGRPAADVAKPIPQMSLISILFYIFTTVKSLTFELISPLFMAWRRRAPSQWITMTTPIHIMAED
ncbi:hypothetical protein F2P81_020334 [Scophthalmus maximus]|uniref:Uncharacterized protein n=1 Tax=Scophthalmus maximus TaxID=52904 RepID=A0A6A4RZQ9_SCOMX|nr:hypothetical protein F2P81_020334 [Scophthalmus maximus]